MDLPSACFSAMFFILSKILYYLVMPASILTLCFLGFFFFRSPLWKKRSLYTGLVLFYLFTNVFVSNELLLWWEEAPKDYFELAPEYEVALVFTGMTNMYKSPKDRVHFNKGADRLMQAVHLYQQGRVKKIMLTGGSGQLLDDEVKEADLLYSVLMDCAVDPTDIILENQAMNTYQNALYSAQLLRENNIQGKVLLISSAFHMKRSAACLSKQNVDFDTFSVDFYSMDRSFTPDVLFIPNEEAFSRWRLLIHEICGYIVYKIVGYA